MVLATALQISMIIRTALSAGRLYRILFGITTVRSNGLPGKHGGFSRETRNERFGVWTLPSRGTPSNTVAAPVRVQTLQRLAVNEKHRKNKKKKPLVINDFVFNMDTFRVFFFFFVRSGATIS